MYAHETEREKYLGRVCYMHKKSPHMAGLVCKMWAIRDGGTAEIGLA